ncbi:hypothetical protein [Haloarcula salinisoli]|uniref:Uncharacterized protein n=1 Tax=Haloarcula salinisoli TaxID=2487746 RepID=A0A8J7YCQ4_9EURY|nr:hypothetical protein [Halomicroarcula salinisoli]MBX0303660.1 hypothetical protein [Halomicroarcula salinisoli]
MVTTRSRGQMILIMSVLFAVTVLTTVVLLNTLHAPANVNTERQASNLGDIERVEGQAADDMERLFQVHTSMNRTGEALPYAAESGGPDDPFGDVVNNTSELNAALSASESGAAVSVSYVEGRSQEGMLVRQNNSTQNFTHRGYSPSEQNWTVLESADGLPRLSMYVTDGPDASDPPFEVVVEGGGGKLTFDDDGVEGAGVDCDLAYPIRVDATGGVGTVSNATDICGEFDLGVPDTFNLTFENGSQAEGTYTISGVEAIDTDIEGNTFDWQQQYDGVVVNPAFRVQYTDPSITHRSTFRLYGESSP